jgi:hypothetical protein
MLLAGRWLPISRLLDRPTHLIKPPASPSGATPVRTHRGSAFGGAIQSHFQLLTFHDSASSCAYRKVYPWTQVVQCLK